MCERMKAVSCVDQEDGIPICADCKVQIGEGEDHCMNCALYECETEIDALVRFHNAELNYFIACGGIQMPYDIVRERKEAIDALSDELKSQLCRLQEDKVNERDSGSG